MMLNKCKFAFPFFHGVSQSVCISFELSYPHDKQSRMETALPVSKVLLTEQYTKKMTFRT